MQAIRDALILAVLGLTLVTVRVDRVPASNWSGEISRAGLGSIADADPGVAVDPTTRSARSLQGLPTPQPRPIRVAVAPEIDRAPDHEHGACACLTDQVELVNVIEQVESIGSGRDWIVIIRETTSDAPTPPHATIPAAIQPDCT